MPQGSAALAGHGGGAIGIGVMPGRSSSLLVCSCLRKIGIVEDLQNQGNVQICA